MKYSRTIQSSLLFGAWWLFILALGGGACRFDSGAVEGRECWFQTDCPAGYLCDSNYQCVRTGAYDPDLGDQDAVEPDDAQDLGDPTDTTLDPSPLEDPSQDPSGPDDPAQELLDDLALDQPPVDDPDPLDLRDDIQDTSPLEDPITTDESDLPQDDTPPAVVADFAAVAGEEAVDLTWTNPPDEDLHSCLVLRRQDGNAPQHHQDGLEVLELQPAEPGEDSSFQDTDVVGGTTYHYAVFCRDESGNWQDVLVDSNSDSATPTHRMPNNPEDVSASIGEDSMVTITFTMPSGSVDSCRVVRGDFDYPTDHEDGEIVGSTYGTGVRVVYDTELTNGETYYYAVFCVNGGVWNDTSDESNQASGTPGSPWWSCLYHWRHEIELAALEAPGEGYSFSLSFDHRRLVDDGLSMPSGEDVRVVYHDGLHFGELHRVLDPLSDWNRDDTTIWFASLSESDDPLTGYFLYYGADGMLLDAALDDEGQVFHFADFFERPNGPVGGNWVITQPTFTKIEIRNQALRFVDVLNSFRNRPIADHVFAPVLERHLAWRFGFAWTRRSVDDTYRVHMQLGRHSTMDAEPGQGWSNAGTGVSLVWGRRGDGMPNHEGFYYDLESEAHQLTTLSGHHDVEVVVDQSERCYSVDINQVTIATDLPFATPASAPTRLDQLRFMTWDVAGAWFDPRQFDYVIVRRLVIPEPLVTLGEVVSHELFCAD